MSAHLTTDLTICKSAPMSIVVFKPALLALPCSRSFQLARFTVETRKVSVQVEPRQAGSRNFREGAKPIGPIKTRKSL